MDGKQRTAGSSFRVHGAKDQSRDSCLQYRPGTHEAGFEGDVQCRIEKSLGFHFISCTLNDEQFRMGRWILLPFP